MRTKCLVLTAILLSFAVATLAADSEAFKKFKDDYAALDQDLLNNETEVAPIKDFIYQKDAATFTFTDGRIFLARYIDGRPTTAFFIGKGHAQIDIPSHVERMSMAYASNDSLVNQDFDVILIKFGDNLDLKLREKIIFSKQTLEWKDYNILKKAQSEFFFRPSIQHEYDNFFQLLRSIYERSDDGFFWCDFNRYVYSYDPNRPEQSIVAYERSGGDLVITDGAVQQRKERAISDDLQMSQILYPTTILERHADLVMGGLEGRDVEQADCKARLLVNADSLKYLSLFLSYNLNLDSMQVNGQNADFYRRRDFNFIGVLLPSTHHKGDTLDVRLWYHGSSYWTVFPYVEDPTPSKVSLTLLAPRGFSYLATGLGPAEKIDKGVKFTIEPDQPYREFFFKGYGSNFDTIKVVSDVGVPLDILKSHSIDKNRVTCFVPDQLYQTTNVDAFNFLCSQLGTPAGVFELYVYPYAPITHPEGTMTMPGIEAIPQECCIVNGTGGFQLVAGYQTAQQWFGSLLRPASDREFWLADAMPEYLSLVYVEKSLPGGAFPSEMLHRRSLLDSVITRKMDMPLAAGTRIPDSLSLYKGAWLMHMLRFLMFDVNTGSDATFMKFVRELALTCNNREFTNADIVKLAEKYYGQPLDWFFKQWLFGRNRPEYTVDYSIVPKDNGFVVKVNVAAAGVDPAFSTPVLMSVAGVKDDGGPAIFRQQISGPQTSFELGPFMKKPSQFQFNEFFSVLSSDKVKQK
ncbi:MAG TPA: hypothetical protein VMS71_03930 [Candidatus Acidoferrum sp.]|nr:hypothetical protein [Candidatus Acidoferrum sp.]